MRPWCLLLAMVVAVTVSAGMVRGDDLELAQVIAGKLRTSGQLRDYDIRVKVDKGTAWLRGRVANERQLNAALALAAETQGVEQVANGLTVWNEPERRRVRAPIASRQPIGPTVEQVRLAPPPATSGPEAGVAPAPIAAIQTPVSPSVLQQPVDPQRLPSSVVDEAAMLLGSLPPEGPAPPVRSLEYATSLEVLPTTVQKASYCPSAGQMHVMDPHTLATLTGAAEPMLLPEDCGASAGEAYASDGADAFPTPPPVAGEDRSLSSASDSPSITQVGEEPALLQLLPEPTRRTWAGTFSQRGVPTMRAVVTDQP